VAFVLLTLIFYPTFKDQTAQLNKSLDNIPQTAKQLFTDTSDIFSPLGYLSSQIFYLMLPLLLSVLAIGAGSALLAKEENDGTIELLLARPVSRSDLLFGKALAGAVVVAAVGFVTTIATIIICRMVGLDIGSLYILDAGAAVILMALCLGSVAFLFSALGRTGRSISIALTGAYGLIGYLLSSLSQTVTWLKWPAKFFPFAYYHSSELLTGTYNWNNILYFIGVGAGCTILAWLAFRRRDLLGS
jgi:ABC-2 type transport system permease protein